MSLDLKNIMYAGEQASDDDKKLFVTFSHEGRLDRKATEEAGHNKYRDVEFVTIRIPGDKTLSIHRPANPSDKQRFPLQYAAFRNNRGEEVVGTPLSLLLGIKPSQVKELDYFNVKTIEQLASMPDGAGGAQMMGVQALRAAARKYVSNALEQAPVAKVEKELAQRDNIIAAQAAQIEEQGKKIEAILAGLAAQAMGQKEAEPQSKKGK